MLTDSQKSKTLSMLRCYLNESSAKRFFSLLQIQSHENVLECAGHLERMRNGSSTEELVFERVRENALFWNDEMFKALRQEENEEIEFLETPLEVVEGALLCCCGSKRVFSFTKQTRAGDESTTVFALCSVCKRKWVM